MIFVTFISGCGEENPYGTVPVTGKVTVDGQPMEGIHVSFVPVSEGGRGAGGYTDAAGGFVLSTPGAPHGGGCVPGGYEVVLDKREGLSKEIKVPNPGKYESDTRSVPTGEVIYHIPQRYSDPKTSGIEPVRVEKGKKNHFTFDLKAK
jgi:hypothetical protein